MKKEILMVAALAAGTGFAAGDLGAAISGRLAKDNWDVCGSFGQPTGRVAVTSAGLSYAEKGYRIDTAVTTGAGGVTSRKSVIKNVSDRPISVRCLMDRFIFQGGEWEVYTQANSYQHESRGRWQPLVTSTGARCASMRTGDSAAPMLAIWNRQEGRGRVFHLLSDGAWEMLCSTYSTGDDPCYVSVDVGFDGRHLDYALKPGEELAFPEVLYYDFTNRLDFECHRLHAYWNARHPATRPQPVIYNSWLACRDHLDLDFLLKQVSKAKAVGVDYFVIDAGWFGPKAAWYTARGDWEERPDGWLGGRLGELSERVRAAGMKFGLWVEAEAPGAKAMKAHPDWFFEVNGTHYLDFTKKEAFDAILESVCALARKYELGFFKFDFNQSAWADPSGRCFIDYNRAYRRFLDEVRRRNPGIYLEGCAAGGYLMNLGWAETFDSFWISDNQSPRYGIRIAKDTMLRFAPRQIERWVVARDPGEIGFDPDRAGRGACVLADVWRRANAETVSTLDAFALGGPYCFSCDLTMLSDERLAHFAKVIAERRKDSDFWNRAVGRILCDTPSVLVLQYDDGTLSDVRLAVIPHDVLQSSMTVRPVLAAGATYSVGKKTLTAEQIAAKGIEVSFGGAGGNSSAQFVTLISSQQTSTR